MSAEELGESLLGDIHEEGFSEVCSYRYQAIQRKCGRRNLRLKLF